MKFTMEPNEGEQILRFEAVTIKDAKTAVRVIRQYLGGAAVQWPELAKYEVREKRDHRKKPGAV